MEENHTIPSPKTDSWAPLNVAATPATSPCLTNDTVKVECTASSQKCENEEEGAKGNNDHFSQPQCQKVEVETNVLASTSKSSPSAEQSKRPQKRKATFSHFRQPPPPPPLWMMMRRPLQPANINLQRRPPPFGFPSPPPPPPLTSPQLHSSEFNKFTVFGLDSFSRTEHILGSYFSVFGRVEHIIICGSLGFVTMARRESVEMIVSILYHTLPKGKIVECRQIFVSMIEVFQTLKFLELATNLDSYTAAGKMPSCFDLLNSRWYYPVLGSTAAKAYMDLVNFESNNSNQRERPPRQTEVQQQIQKILEQYWNDYQQVCNEALRRW